MDDPVRDFHAELGCRNAKSPVSVGETGLRSAILEHDRESGYRLSEKIMLNQKDRAG
jgi:hypothetical protein